MRTPFPGLGAAVPVTALLVIAALAGGSLASPAVSAAACAAILLFGLPHGSLDIELIRRGCAGARLTGTLAVYLGIAAATAVIWWVAPIVALAGFIVIAVAHFAEDWEGVSSRFLAEGVAVALIAAPAMLHRQAVAAIFVALTGSTDAARLADCLLLAAPMTLAIAVVAVVAMAGSGRVSAAVAATASLVALVVLPPVPGFAVFFCLFHSPRHFVAALHAAQRLPVGRWLPVVVPVTAAALALVTGVYLLHGDLAVPQRLTAATFMVLAILTVPHMLAPAVLNWLTLRSRLLPAPRSAIGHVARS